MSRLKIPRALSSGNEMIKSNKSTKINTEAKVADKSDGRRLRGNASRGIFHCSKHKQIEAFVKA